MYSLRILKPRSVFYLILHVILVATAVMATLAFHRFHFEGDGLVYYTGLRNLVRGYGLWAGPYYKFLLGNHSYLTLVLFAPLTKIIGSSILMIFLSLGCWYVGTLFFYSAANRILDQQWMKQCSLAEFLAISFMLCPIMVHGLTGFEIFQPDLFLIPSVMAIFYGISTGKRWIWISASLFLVASKEEYIVLFPVLVTWMLVCSKASLGSRALPSRRELLVLAVGYLVISTAAVLILKHFRSVNVLNVAARSPSFSALLIPELWSASASDFLKLILPVIPWIFLFSRSATRPSWMILGSTIVIFLAGRLVGDMIIYARPPLLFWHSRVVVAPAIFIGLTLAFAASRTPQWTRSHLAVCTLFVAILVPIFKVDPLRQFLRLRTEFRLTDSQRVQMQQITAWIGKPSSPRDALLLPHFHCYPFLSDWNYITYSFWISGNRAPNLLADVTKVLVIKKYKNLSDINETSLKPEDLARLRSVFPIVRETQDYYLLERQLERRQLVLGTLATERPAGKPNLVTRFVELN